MSYNPYQNHLDETVLGAGPIELVALLYGGLRDAVARSRQSLALGDIQGRSHQISRAMEIVAELAGSLDTVNGGPLAENLMRLYHFINVRLADGHCRQVDEPLAEAERVVQTLNEAWQELSAKAAAEAVAAAPPVYAGAYSTDYAEASLSVCG